MGLQQGAGLGPLHNCLHIIGFGLAPLSYVVGKPARQVWQKSSKLWTILCQRDTDLRGMQSQQAACLSLIIISRLACSGFAKQRISLPPFPRPFLWACCFFSAFPLQQRGVGLIFPSSRLPSNIAPLSSSSSCLITEDKAWLALHFAVCCILISLL